VTESAIIPERKTAPGTGPLYGNGICFDGRTESVPQLSSLIPPSSSTYRQFRRSDFNGSACFGRVATVGFPKQQAENEPNTWAWEQRKLQARFGRLPPREGGDRAVSSTCDGMANCAFLPDQGLKQQTNQPLINLRSEGRAAP